MLQRPRDAYLRLDTEQRSAVDRALEGTGLAPWFRSVSRHRLGKRNFKLVFEGASAR